MKIPHGWIWLHNDTAKRTRTERTQETAYLKIVKFQVGVNYQIGGSHLLANAIM